MKLKTRAKVSLVLPLYNEVEMLPLLFIELQKQLSILKRTYGVEVLFVDDGSDDDTFAKLKSYKKFVPHKSISFSRNFGHQAALLAGLREATGDVVITMDGDLQHPPAFIHQLLKAYEKGVDIVFTKRAEQKSLSYFKRTSSGWFYKVLNLFSSTKIQEAGSDFRLMSREAVDTLLLLPEKRIFLRGMVSWIGFKTITLTFSAQKRHKGESKYNLTKMVSLAVFGITSFSAFPLYISAFVGFIFSIATVLYGVYVLFIRFVIGGAVEGWSSVIFVLLGIGSILSFLMALLGIYLAALYDEVKQRPIYIIKK